MVFIVVIVIPLIVYILSVVPVLTSGGNDWAGFWGGYIGAIIGAVVTLIGVKLTLEENRNSEVRPYLIFEEIDTAPEQTVVPTIIGNLSGETEIINFIKLRNVGKGIAKDIVISGEQKWNIKIPILESDSEKYIAINSYFTVPREIAREDKGKVQGFVQQQKKENIILQCTDLYGNIFKYQMVIEYECAINYAASEPECTVESYIKTWKAVQIH